MSLKYLKRRCLLEVIITVHVNLQCLLKCLCYYSAMSHNIKLFGTLTGGLLR